MTPFPALRLISLGFISLLAAVGLSSCGTDTSLFGSGGDARNKMIVSVRDQKMLLVGDRPGSNCTPLGRLQVAKKIGDNAAMGSVFKARRATGEVIKPNSPGRDPVVTRIMWLTGTEIRNHNAFKRTIYIHGTPEERRLGTPASYGCIRMGSRDVADLYARISKGADVFIIRGSIQTGKPDSAAASAVKTLFPSRS